MKRHLMRWGALGLGLSSVALWLGTGCSPAGPVGDASADAGDAGDAADSGGDGPAPGPGEGTGGSPSIEHEKDYSIAYYRLRVEFLDQGDWATLQVIDPTLVIKTRLLEQVGTANVLSIDKGQIGLNTDFGSDLSVVVDFALTTDALEQPFEFSLTKGGAGSVTIRISLVVGDDVTLIKEINEQATPLDFSIDLSALADIEPTLAPLAPVEKKGIALYYPWYSLDSWNSDQLLDKPSAPYASDDAVALARQMEEAKSAGVTGFAVSWIGPDSSSDHNVALMLDVAAEHDFTIGFFFETTIGNLTNNPQALADWFGYIAETYGDHPGLMQVDGKAVVIPWLTCDTTAENWASARELLRADDLDVWLMQDCQDMDYLSIFDGVWYDGGIGGLGEKVRYYSVLADEPKAKLWIPTAMPGFDEHLLPDRVNPRVYPREDGEVYKKALSTAIANSPHWVAVYTWNEWFENTYIEPSENFGDQYLRLTEDYVGAWLE